MRIRLKRSVLESAYEYISQHSSEFDWSEWVVHNRCGTQACIAGWIAVLNCEQPNIKHNNFISPATGQLVGTCDATYHTLFVDWKDMTFDDQYAASNLIYEFLFVPSYGHWETDFPSHHSSSEERNESRQEALRRIKWILDGHKLVDYIAPGREFYQPIVDLYGKFEIELV